MPRRLLSNAVTLARHVILNYLGFIREVTHANFGLLIAFVIPGSLLLWGLEPYSETIQAWLAQSAAEPATVAGFLYVTVVSVGLGQVVSTLRWLIIDRVLEKAGVERQPQFEKLNQSTEAFDRLVELHYRYYQGQSNSLVALWLAAPLRWTVNGFHFGGFVLLLIVTLLLWLGAADTLRKYRRGLRSVLGS